MPTLKEKAVDLIRQMPDQATWDDIMYEIYVRKKIDQGLKDVEENRVLSHDEAKKRFGVE